MVSDPEKDKKTPEVPTEEIADAVIIEEQTPEPSEPPADDDAPVIEDAAGPDVDENKADEAEEALDQDAATDDVAEDLPEDADEPPQHDAAEVQDVSEPETPPAPIAEPAPRKGGFVPLVLGGIVAAGLGFGASRFVFPEGWPGVAASSGVEQMAATIQKQADALAKLESRLTKVEARPATPPELETLPGSVSALNDSVTDLTGKLTAVEARLSALEKRPVAEGGAPAAAVEAYERELKALKDAMDKQKAEIQGLLDAATQQKADAELTAQQAMIRSAVSRVQVALDTGKGFAGALSDLTAAGVDVPPTLSKVSENGVATMTELAAEFPEPARKALAAARKAEGSGGSAWNFLRNQLGLRSLEPKEGADADAVLSRAEAALADDRLADALAELEVLPEQGRVELTDWMAKATQRVEAVAAAEDLSAQVASN